jgi:hypothetical protein
MSSGKRENIEQIPKDDNLGEVQKAVSEQGGVEGQRKEVRAEMQYSKFLRALKAKRVRKLSERGYMNSSQAENSVEG